MVIINNWSETNLEKQIPGEDV